MGTEPQASFPFRHAIYHQATSRGPALERDFKSSITGHHLWVSANAGDSVLVVALGPYLNQLSKSWCSEPTLFRLWIFTALQLVNNRSRESVQTLLIPCCNKEPSPRETFSKLMMMGLRRMTIMIPWLILPLLVPDSGKEGTFIWLCLCCCHRSRSS